MAENDENPPEPERERRLDDLTQRTADDVATLARTYAGVARDEMTEAGARAVWPTAVAAIGGLLAIVGAGVLVTSPAVPSGERRLKRRMRAFGFGYLIVGGLGAVVGVLALGSEVTNALPRTRGRLRALVDAFRRRV
jgi:hypothetical protein